jgi:hypothetical protein
MSGAICALDVPGGGRGLRARHSGRRTRAARPTFPDGGRGLRSTFRTADAVCAPDIPDGGRGCARRSGWRTRFARPTFRTADAVALDVPGGGRCFAISKRMRGAALVLSSLRRRGFCAQQPLTPGAVFAPGRQDVHGLEASPLLAVILGRCVITKAWRADGRVGELVDLARCGVPGVVWWVPFRGWVPLPQLDWCCGPQVRGGAASSRHGRGDIAQQIGIIRAVRWARWRFATRPRRPGHKPTRPLWQITVNLEIHFVDSHLKIINSKRLAVPVPG